MPKKPHKRHRQRHPAYSDTPSVANAPEAEPDSESFIHTPHATPTGPWQDIYAQNALWQCLNIKTQSVHQINGVLAQVLKRYPDDYDLTFLSPKGA